MMREQLYSSKAHARRIIYYDILYCAINIIFDFIIFDYYGMMYNYVITLGLCSFFFVCIIITCNITLADES